MDELQWQDVTAWAAKHRVFLAAAAASLLVLAAGMASWRLPAVRAGAASAYHAGARYLGMERQGNTVAVAPSPAVAGTALPMAADGWKEGVAAQKAVTDALASQLAATQDALKDIQADLAATNDLLDTRQREWLATLRKVGVAGSIAASSGGTDSLTDGGEDGGASASPAVLNLNTASATDLDALPGIGPTYAQRIVDYRTQHGPFAKVEDILNVSGIGQSTLDKFKGQVTV